MGKHSGLITGFLSQANLWLKLKNVWVKKSWNCHLATTWRGFSTLHGAEGGTCDETNTGYTLVYHRSREPHTHTDVRETHTAVVSQMLMVKRQQTKVQQDVEHVFTLAICSRTIQCLMDSTMLWKESTLRKEVKVRGAAGAQEGERANGWLTQVVSFRFSIFCKKRRH